jgi:lipid A 4'-phosphatase
MNVRRRRLWPAWGLLTASVLLFLAWPELDLIVTHYFFDPINQQFPANELPWVKWVYDDTPVINQWLGLLMVSALLLQRIRPGWPVLRVRRSMCAWLLVVCIGLGFAVDWVLKDHFGRPHPYQTHVFTGDQDFVPAFYYRPLCELNCSFVSGHAAGGFVWMAWGMWGGRRRRQGWLLAGVAAGSFIGAARIMQGGHFLSDVVFSGWVIWLSMQAIRAVWLRRRWRRRQTLKQVSTP